MSIGGHQSPSMFKDEWLTPPELIRSFGEFDLDPCAPVIRPWDTAETHYTIEHNGLDKPWFGRVWMNPPYGQQTGTWLKRLADHGNGLALIFARTETKMFSDYVWNRADALLFIAGRLHFYHVDGSRAKGNAGAPSVLVAYGKEEARRLKMHTKLGQFVALR